MTLPVATDLAPMESRSVDLIPKGEEWIYEPKWDGFRCLAFRDGDTVEMQSKAGQPLARYFPELVETLQTAKLQRFVVDGEIVVPVSSGDALSFDDLLQRLHPAQSRIKRLSAETPAVLIIFDLLVDSDGNDLTARPLAERRQALEKFFSKHLAKIPRLKLSPATTDFNTASQWYGAAGAATDGIMAKKLTAAYASGKRDAMVKIKPIRTADCVVGGFRYASKRKVVGSLLLGLYDAAGLLHHIGFCSGLTAKQRQALTPELEKIIQPPGFTGSAPGGPSRWSTERSTQWEPLRPEIVVEVGWDHFTNGRFRHGTRLIRWRIDKAPSQCTFDQVASPGADSFALLNKS